MSNSTPKNRLAHFSTSLQPVTTPSKELLGELKLGGLSLPIYTSNHPDRLVKSDTLLDLADPTNAANLYWILQKSILGQDIFLYGPPGVYARRLALTYCSMINSTFEYVSLHRDVGEGELKQGREIREGGRLEHVDSAAVRAVKNGSILILDGIERAERGVLPILNNLLENREMNLEDGTHIVSADRYELMVKNKEDTTNFIAASRDFRVIALGAPVPPYPGFPLDPPFRSRFQSRYLDPLAVSKVLSVTLDPNPHPILEKTSQAIITLQVMKEMRTKMASGVTSSTEIPGFPQTALLKLTAFLSVFPPPLRAELSTSAQFMNVLLAIHPALSYISSESWRSLENAFGNEGAGLGEWTNGISECDSTVVGATGEGIWGWELTAIERASPATASVTFTRGGVEKNVVTVAAGPLDFTPYPLVKDSEGLHLSPRFQHLLTSLFQLHALKDFDIAFLPSSSSLQTSSASTTVIISTFAALLGYQLETIHLYKELGGREIWMRRIVENGIMREGTTTTGKKVEAGTTGWELSPLLKGAFDGKLVHLEGIDAIGPTVGSLSRLLNEREGELWEGKRIVGGEALTEAETLAGLYKTHPSFRVIATASKSVAPREWLTEELSSIFISLPSLSMLPDEEKALLVSTGCSPDTVTTLLAFARAYRSANSAATSKARRLGTGGLLRIAKRLSKFPGEGLWEILNRTLLTEFLATTTRGEVTALMAEHRISAGPSFWNPPAVVGASTLLFPASSDPQGRSQDYSIDLYDLSKDPEGAAFVPFMNNYLDNSQQTALMRDIATDLEVMGNNILLMGNQGTGKNKIIDRLLQLMRRPREFIQLHRDSTTQSLMFNTVLSGGVIAYIDSPLIRAVRMGRVIVIDEVDKAGAAVTAVLASLATRGEMSLADGRRIRPNSIGAEPSDIIVHPDFRLILLSNRSGQGFLGNAFLRVVGDSFSTYSVSNPDPQSEEKILTQLAPDIPVETLRSLIAAFADLRIAFDAGTLSYPFSLRELLALVRHMKRFPEDSLEQTLRNVFDFDINRPETIDALYDILRKHKLAVDKLGIDAVRVGSEATKAPIVIEFKPTGDTSLSEPKYGKDTDKAHKGGNTWAGGTGGRDTAGLGGRGGYMRLYKGHDISQIPDSLKADVPDAIKSQAREMARKELAARLAEIDMTSGQASAYSGYHDAVRSHVNQLVNFLDNLEAQEEERVWLKRKSDGELDETRLTEGLTGESSIYKQRGLDAPEIGRPQLKPKRLRFIFDCSASMYRNQYDGRLARSLETAVMIMESFAKLQRKEKFRVDLVGQSGEEAVIPLVTLDSLSNLHAGERYKVIQRMAVTSQIVWSGDNTIEAIVAGVAAVADSDSDDYFCIIITDANFERYGISSQDLKKSMDSNPKVKCALIAIGEGAESTWIPRELPGRGYRVKETSDIATTLRSILGTMLASAM